MRKSFLLFAAAMGFSIMAQGQIVPQSKDLFVHGYRDRDSREILKKEVAVNAEDDFRHLNQMKDELGKTHTRFQQFYKGIKVEFATQVVHSNKDLVESINGDFVEIKEMDVTPRLSERKALDFALRDAAATKFQWETDSEIEKPTGELVILPNIDASGKPSLAYKFDVYVTEPTVSRHDVYVDANTGQVLYKNARIHHVAATGTLATRYSGTKSSTTDSFNGSFRLRDYTRASGIETYNMKTGTNYSTAVDFTDADNSWTEYNNTAKDNAALDAHWGAQMTFDYFKNTHNRNSYNNAGAVIKSYVHYNKAYDNAFWDGQRMTYGDGSGTYFDALTSLDVAAHEIGHAVCETTANLVYQKESGAMNEGFSDIWAACVEYFAAPTKATWLIGEDIERRAGHAALRSMSDPNAEGQPDTYGGTYWINPNCTPSSTNDYCGVHTNSGVLNHWFYILAIGKSGTNDLGNAFNVTGISIDKAARIAYRLESVYLTSTSTFANARSFGIQAAKDLYGAGSAEEIAVTNAFYAVGVGAAYGSTTPPPTSAYCTSKGNSTADEWINQFSFGGIVKTSGNNSGYGNYTATSLASALRGSAYSIVITPAWRATKYAEGYGVWIDYNGDGDFADTGETVATWAKTTSTSVTKSITIPTTATLGNTRMRVSMKYNATPTACETFSYGEVEDYTLTISSGVATIENVDSNPQARQEGFDFSEKISIYPNPANSFLNIRSNGAERLEVRVMSITGAEVMKSNINNGDKLDVSGLDKGIYLIQINDGKEQSTHKFFKQ